MPTVAPNPFVQLYVRTGEPVIITDVIEPVGITQLLGFITGTDTNTGNALTVTVLTAVLTPTHPKALVPVTE